VWEVWEEGTHGRTVPVNKLGPTGDVDVWTPEFHKDPLQPRLRVLTPKERASLEEACQAWTSQGYIETTKAWVRCNPLFVPKKSGALRPCIDYRPINAAVRDFSWPLPRISDVRHLIKRSVRFTRYDIRQAFHRIRIPEWARAATAFHTHFGDFQFNRMPFGLKTGPSVFQRFIEWVLKAHRGHVIIYSDDILVHTTQGEDHMRVARAVRRTIERNHMEIAEEKSEEDLPAIDFVGLRLSRSSVGISIDDSRLDTWPIPYTKQERQSFLGFVNCFRNCVPGFATLAKPLYPDKDNRTLASDYPQQMRTLIRAVLSRISLAHYVDNQPATLYTDASLYGTGAVLVQNGKVCAVSSKSLNSAQTRYSTTDREHLALLLGCESFRIFLQSQTTCTVHTDHQALLNRDEDKMTPRQLRWKTRIEAITTNFVYSEGASNPADYWSRQGTKALGGGGGVHHFGYK
jgi:hypothetical protein